MGAAFRFPVWDCTTAELSALLRRSKLPLYGAALRPDAKDIRDADLSRCAIAIGSEESCRCATARLKSPCGNIASR